MKIIKQYTAFLLILVLTPAIAADSFGQLNQFLSSFKSMQADFQQKIIIKKNVEKISSGTMALERPGKFRWETTRPNRQVIIADGQYLWFYDVDLEQATQQNIKKDANSPAILLSGSMDALRERFKIIDTKLTDNESRFHLAPRKEHDMVKEIELVFKNNELNQMVVIDNIGQQTIFSFSKVKINPKLSSHLFHFKPPKGVDVVKQ
jgi:outer membrane lipoprotein carrier protein